MSTHKVFFVENYRKNVTYHQFICLHVHVHSLIRTAAVSSISNIMGLSNGPFHISTGYHHCSYTSVASYVTTMYIKSTFSFNFG